MKGQAVIYRRKTLDMLLDLINDLDDICKTYNEEKRY